jgi:SAM-dependent methyltransferase
MLWDLKAHLYHWLRWLPPWGVLATRERLLLTKALEEVAEPVGRVLDLATGTGHSLALLADRSALYGLDRSRAMLRHAKRRVPQAHLVQGDALVPPLRTGSFGLVTCIGLAEYLSEMGNLLQVIGDLLRPGGVAVVSVSPKNVLLTARKVLGHRLYHHDTMATRRAAAASGLVVDRVLVSCSQWLYVLRKVEG